MFTYILKNKCSINQRSKIKFRALSPTSGMSQLEWATSGARPRPGAQRYAQLGRGLRPEGLLMGGRERGRIGGRLLHHHRLHFVSLTTFTTTHRYHLGSGTLFDPFDRRRWCERRLQESNGIFSPFFKTQWWKKYGQDCPVLRKLLWRVKLRRTNKCKMKFGEILRVSLKIGLNRAEKLRGAITIMEKVENDGFL